MKLLVIRESAHFRSSRGKYLRTFPLKVGVLWRNAEVFVHLVFVFFNSVPQSIVLMHFTTGYHLLPDAFPTPPLAGELTSAASETNATERMESAGPNCCVQPEALETHPGRAAPARCLPEDWWLTHLHSGPLGDWFHKSGLHQRELW